MITSSIIDKPLTVFDRTREWSELVRFCASASSRLGLLYGRRRLGKTHLVEHLAEAAGGMYFCAAQQSIHANLADLGDAVSRWLGSPTPVRYRTWDEALTHLLNASPPGMQSSPLVVLDEVGYIVESDPSFASVLQRALDRRPRPKTKLLLSGSNQSVMRTLTGSGQPLRGRASLELVLNVFDFPTAADFWNVSDSRTAILLWSVVGGTPGYRELCDNHAPRTEKTFPDWLATYVLSDSAALHREGRIVVMEEAVLADPSSHWSVLSAVSGGATTRDAIGRSTGRPVTSLGNSLTVLAGSGLVARIDDPLHARRSTYVIDEPIVTTWKELVEPIERRMLRSGLQRLFDDIEAPLHARVVAPAFERLVAAWATNQASETTLGGHVTAVGPSFLGRGFGDPNAAQIDLVAVERTSSGRRRLLMIGEVKHRIRPVGLPELHRLEALRERLTANSGPTSRDPVKLLLACDAGFQRDLLRLSRRRGDIELVDADRLRHGS